MTDKIVVLVTCKTTREARHLGRTIVERRLAACVNVISAPVESIYRWKGGIARAKEILVVIKTTRRRFARVRDAIQDLHSYDVPEIIAIPIAAGLKEYLAWIDECVAAQRIARESRKV